MSHNVHYAGNDRHHAEVDVEIDLGPDPHSSSAVRGPDSSHSSQQDRAFRRGERCGHCFRRRWIRWALCRHSSLHAVGLQVLYLWKCSTFFGRNRLSEQYYRP